MSAGPGDVALAGEMVLRGLLRRRLALALLVVLPLAFFAARHELVGQSIRFLTLGVAWSVSTVAFFAAVDAADAEHRLRLIGWSPWALLTGRVAALLGLGWTLSVGYLLLVVGTQEVRNAAGVGLDLATTTLIGVLLGTFLGKVARRELEGALLLFILAGMQFAADPPTLLAHVLPFWSTRELGTWAIDGPRFAPLGGGLLHAAATAALLLVATVGLTRRRRGVRRAVSRGRASGPRAAAA